MPSCLAPSWKLEQEYLQVQSHMNKCYFQGSLAHDPDSSVLVNKCKQVRISKFTKIYKNKKLDKLCLCKKEKLRLKRVCHKILNLCFFAPYSFFQFPERLFWTISNFIEFLQWDSNSKYAPWGRLNCGDGRSQIRIFFKHESQDIL